MKPPKRRLAERPRGCRKPIVPFWRKTLTASLRLFTKLKVPLLLARTLTFLAGTAQGQYRRTATLFGLAEQANSQIHHAYAGPLRAQTDVALATVRAALDPASFAEAFAAGQQLSLGEAFATILAPAAVASNAFERPHSS